jgi:small GTP-binding protein
MVDEQFQRSMLGRPPAAKVVFLGNSGAGKTSILQYALTSSPKSNPVPTVGCNCQLLTIPVEDQDVLLNIWDTAGQELYRSLVPIYVRSATAALFVYDVTDLASLQSLDHWHSILVAGQSTTKVNIYIVANKNDLPVVVDSAVGQQYAENLHAKFFEVSALTGAGIPQLFNTVATDLIAQQTAEIPPSALPASDRCC